GIAHAGVKETTSARGEYGPAVDSFETSAYQPLLAPAPARKVEESVASRQTNLPGGMDVSDKAEPYTERDIQEFIEEPIWLVEKTQREETYSNGLEIVTSYQVDNTPRQYVAFSKTAKEIPDEQNISSEVRGILYHASESDLVPFEPEKNRVIKLYSTQLRQFLCRKKLYNYLIDRFGRVFRIVRDDHAAFHAGNSVWADDRQIFLNLNHAFLGICFESKGFETADEADSSQPKMAMTGDSIINDAQVRAGRELTDWLRFRYRIAERNCVTHGITSIYPEDGLIGYHLDLAYGFPFQRFGLRDKYKEPLPSIVEYGFTYDQYFLKIFQGRLWPGILLSENLLKRKAELAGMSFTAYRESLKQRFTHDFEWQEERLTENIGN
ncbi:MAG: N-acetylmuramoyl-L-alanine amidase, partial [bacterium]